MDRPDKRTTTRAMWQRCAVALAIAVGLGSLQFAVAEPAHASPPALAASPETRQIAAWAIAHGDNDGLPFAIVDKPRAMVFAFDAHGALVGSAPVLIGLARGDQSPPGIGDRMLAAITPAERITPAGRFVAVLGKNLAGKHILWVDYDAAISLHPVVTTNPAERRLQRLATPSAADNRVSYGCINVPAAFFAGVVSPLFETNGGIVYILPDTHSIASIFFGRPVPATHVTTARNESGGEVQDAAMVRASSERLDNIRH